MALDEEEGVWFLHCSSFMSLLSFLVFFPVRASGLFLPLSLCVVAFALNVDEGNLVSPQELIWGQLILGIIAVLTTVTSFGMN
jgi:hypothetical protein